MLLILIVRIALTVLAVGFLGWLGYVIYLGLSKFFNEDNKSVSYNHKKRRGGIPVD